MTATLVEVQEHGAWARPGAARPPFAVVFALPPRTPIAQGMYPLDHPALGRHELFLTPLRDDASGGRCEAVFT